MQIRGAATSVRMEKSGLIQVDSTKLWTDARDTFVRPEHCDHIVFKADPKDARWLFVIEIAPRSKRICKGLEYQEATLQEALEDAHLPLVEIPQQLQDLEPTTALQEPLEDEIDGNFIDETVEKHLDIDDFGANDLQKDDHIEDF